MKRQPSRNYKWDEENRLLAADENGFVSNYWYDADGERTVKTSGENEVIYVNSEFSGGNTSTARFSLYVSPYLVAGQGGKYTKHIYVGSQRIVSKLGDLTSYGADPRRIPYAGHEADGLTINYKDKYNQQLQSIKDNYKTFDLPYNGQDNDDYVNGQGFCCNDGTPEAAQARAMARTRAANGDFKPNDDYEKMQFYYHPDHLGSSSYITNLDDEVAQHIEYVPFGEVFIEERNNTWNTPYLFNAKEFDEETGKYYYGARYYEPRLSLWMTCDPLQEKNINISTYCYTFNRPVVLIDPNGEFPILPIVKGIIKLSVMYYTTATALENSSKSDLRQIGYGMKHPINALKVGYYDEGSNNISTIASNFEINIVNKANLGKRGEGTSGNAIRHTLWQAIITKEIDATHAERIGNAHEDNSKLDMNQKVFDNMASADASADLHNNIIGRKIGTNNPKASNVNLAKLVLKEYKEKGLWTVTKINGKYHLQRTKISQKQYELGVQEINKKNNYGKNK